MSSLLSCTSGIAGCVFAGQKHRKTTSLNAGTEASASPGGPRSFPSPKQTTRKRKPQGASGSQARLEALAARQGRQGCRVPGASEGLAAEAGRAASSCSQHLSSAAESQEAASAADAQGSVRAVDAELGAGQVLLAMSDVLRLPVLSWSQPVHGGLHRCAITLAMGKG